MRTSTERLHILLKHLGARGRQSTPKGVGLKTCLVAKDLGLIEIHGDIRNPTLQRTEAGLAYWRRHIRAQRQQQLGKGAKRLN
jgi:hypothetical protein